MRLSAGSRLAQYEILEPLGSGGMGEVYRAADTTLRRTVAIKLVTATADADTRAHLLREARAASVLSHPHICTIHEIRHDTDPPFLVMEFVDGKPLSQTIPSDGLPPATVLRYGSQIADGLAHAHAQGVIHRDLKSANVAITADGRAKILDFGIAVRGERAALGATTESHAALTPGDPIAGTLMYMAPEVLQGAAASPSSDVWSLGILLYEMAAGRLPFGGRTPFEVAGGIQHGTPEPLPARVPPGLAAVIRRCLEKAPAHRYQNAGELRAALDAVQGGLSEMPAQTAPRRSRRAAIAAIALALAAFAALGAWKLSTRAADPVAPPVRSIAVLPLASLSRETADEEFAEGMTDELIASLAKIHGLQVKSRSAAMKYRGSTLSAGQIARQLGVDAVVDASILRSGDRIRIMVGLVEAGSDRQMWSQRYERPLSDILALQSDVARAVAGELQVTLTPHDRSRLSAGRRVNADAYQLYVRGMMRFARHNNAENLAAIGMLEEAIARDPDFADAHGGVAVAYALRAFAYEAHNRAAMESKARAALERALALDPDNSNAHLASGRLLWSREHGWPHADGIQQMRKAVRLNPASEHAARHLGIIYNHVGYPAQALEEFHRADVVHPAALVQIGMAHQIEGRLQEALGAFQTAPPNLRTPFLLVQMTSVLVQLGRAGDAQAALDEYAGSPAADDYSGHFSAARALVAAVAGRTREAEAEIEKSVARRESGEFHHASYVIAAAYVRMRQPREALRWLEHTAADGFPCYPLFARDPELDPLRRDPAFTAFLARQRALWERHRAVVTAQ